MMAPSPRTRTARARGPWEVAYCPRCGAEMGRGPAGFNAGWWCTAGNHVAAGETRYEYVDEARAGERGSTRC